MNQCSFSDLEYMSRKKVTRRQQMLEEMDKVIPWERLSVLLRPLYPTGEGGRPSKPLETMLRIYCVQQWFGLSDPGAEEALLDSNSIRHFCRCSLAPNSIPDETTILNFRKFLHDNDLTEKIFELVVEYLREQGLIVCKGTIVDATIIHSPTSTKNSLGKDGRGARDPDASSTKKAGQWHFGIKAHVGADAEYGLVHTIEFTSAKVHDSQVMEDLLHGKEKNIYGDKAYDSSAKEAEYQARGVSYRVTKKAHRGQELTERQKLVNHRRSRIRCRGEHAFGVVKHLWKYVKTRYRGLIENGCHMYMLFAMANIYMVRYLIKDDNNCYILSAS